MSSPQEAADELEVEIDATVQALTYAARARAYQAANELRNSAMTVLANDGHGRKYGKHTASAPGETPAPNTGNLRRNWRQYVFAELGLHKTKITCRIKSDMPYAGILETGGKRMAARPYADKVKDGAMPNIDRIYGGLK